MPIVQVAGHEMSETATQGGDGMIEYFGGHQLVKALALRLIENAWIAKMEGVIVGGRLGVRRYGLLDKGNAISARCNAQPLCPVRSSHGMKGIEGIAVVQEGAGADRAFFRLADRQRQGMMRPLHEIDG